MLPEPDLMDTNIFIHLVRNDAIGKRLKAEYNLLMQDVRPVYCTVTEGETRSFALQRNWGEERTTKLSFLLGYFVGISLEKPEIYIRYAEIDEYSHKKGIKMGKNDLWIAAVASVMGYRLLTTDADFDHLDPVFLTRFRIEYDDAR